MTYKSLTKKAGQFRAVCRQGAWLPVDQLTADERADAERRDQEGRRANVLHNPDIFRWDRKLKTEVALITCSLDTTDRDEYLAHMARFHGQKPRNVMRADDSTQSLSNRARGKWRTPKAKSEGSPLTKAITEATVTCEDCGLVMENGSRLADELYIREHLEFCAAEAGAA